MADQNRLEQPDAIEEVREYCGWDVSPETGTLTSHEVTSTHLKIECQNNSQLF